MYGMELSDPETFIASLSQFSFQEKYFKLVEFLKQVRQSSSEYYQASLQLFVQLFPFNHTYWAELLDLILRMPKGKSNSLKMYQIALAKNPRCIELWRKYLIWLKKELIRSDPNYLINQLQNASRTIGNHFKAAFVFEYYSQVEQNVVKRFNMLKRGIVSPVEEIDRIREILFNLIDSEQFIPYTLQIAENQGLSIQKNQSSEYLRILQEEIKQRISLKLYQPTKQHTMHCVLFQEKITATEYIPYSDSIENWRNYISFIKNSGNNQFLPSIYERALITQCDNEALWEQYFLFLENENNHQRALYLLRSHSQFFRNMSKQLTYYWLQIQERDNPTHARELYLELERRQCDLQVFMRHISMQIRSKDYQNAKAIYEAILTIFTSSLPIISYTVVQYADFTVKHFRDINFAKKLLQTYFKSYPFNQSLFLSLLQFYQNNIEIKENTKEGKQISDQFIEIILLGLKKAHQCLQLTEYKNMKKVATHHMRSYILSIYLIKIADRKIKEQQILAQKQMLDHNGKRSQPQNPHFEIQPNVLGRKRIPN